MVGAKVVKSAVFAARERFVTYRTALHTIKGNLEGYVYRDL